MRSKEYAHGALKGEMGEITYNLKECVQGDIAIQGRNMNPMLAHVWRNTRAQAETAQGLGRMGR